DDVPAAWGGMPVEVVVGRHFAEDDAGGRQPRRQPSRRGRFLELDLHVLEVRFPVLIRVEMMNLHGTFLSVAVALARSIIVSANQADNPPHPALSPVAGESDSRINSRIRSGDSGMSRTRTPNGWSASSTASAINAG